MPGSPFRSLYEQPLHRERQVSYFRRAVRPNELFFVYRTEDRKALQGLVEELARSDGP